MTSDLRKATGQKSRSSEQLILKAFASFSIVLSLMSVGFLLSSRSAFGFGSPRK